MLSGVPGFVLDLDGQALPPGPKHGLSGDVDLLVRNEANEGPLRMMGPKIAVGCSARSSRPVQGSDVSALVGELASEGWTTGLFFSSLGFGPSARQAAGAASRNQFYIGLLGPEQIRMLIAAADRARVIQEAVVKSLLDGREFRTGC